MRALLPFFFLYIIISTKTAAALTEECKAMQVPLMYTTAVLREYSVCIAHHLIAVLLMLFFFPFFCSLYLFSSATDLLCSSHYNKLSNVCVVHTMMDYELLKIIENSIL